MATKKKSLTVKELAEKIRCISQKRKGITAKQIMGELRKSFTFSKDKWAAARKMLAPAGKKVVKNPTCTKPACVKQTTKITKKPCKGGCVIEFSCTDNNTIKKVYDLLDDLFLNSDLCDFADFKSKVNKVLEFVGKIKK